MCAASLVLESWVVAITIGLEFTLMCRTGNQYPFGFSLVTDVVGLASPVVDDRSFLTAVSHSPIAERKSSISARLFFMIIRGIAYSVPASPSERESSARFLLAVYNAQ